MYKCVELADKWDKERDSDYSAFKSDDVKNFITSQKSAYMQHLPYSPLTGPDVFLDALDTKATFPPQAIKAIGKLYGFEASENAEIRNRFYRIALRSGPDYAQDAASEDCAYDRGRTSAEKCNRMGHQQGQDEVLSTDLPRHFQPGRGAGQEDLFEACRLLRESLQRI